MMDADERAYGASPASFESAFAMAPPPVALPAEAPIGGLGGGEGGGRGGGAIDVAVHLGEPPSGRSGGQGEAAGGAVQDAWDDAGASSMLEDHDDGAAAERQEEAEEMSDLTEVAGAMGEEAVVGDVAPAPPAAEGGEAAAEEAPLLGVAAMGPRRGSRGMITREAEIRRRAESGSGSGEGDSSSERRSSSSGSLRSRGSDGIASVTDGWDLEVPLAGMKQA